MENPDDTPKPRLMRKIPGSVADRLDKTKLEDERHLGRIVHFFLYDYKFERVEGS